MMLLSDLTIQLLVMRLIAGLVIFAVQGAVIAATAVALGDLGPRHDGRLTLWPVPHVDMLGLGSLALTGFGWARPMEIESGKMTLGRIGPILAILAASACLLLLGYLVLLLVIPLLTALPPTAGLTAAAFVRVMARLCVWMALFSLLPIPPLAGAHILSALNVPIPKQTGFVLGWAILIASAFGITRMVLAPAYNLVAPLILGVDVAIS